MCIGQDKVSTVSHRVTCSFILVIYLLPIFSYLYLLSSYCIPSRAQFPVFFQFSGSLGRTGRTRSNYLKLILGVLLLNSAVMLDNPVILVFLPTLYIFGALLAMMQFHVVFNLLAIVSVACTARV